LLWPTLGKPNLDEAREPAEQAFVIHYLSFTTCYPIPNSI